MSFEIDLHMLQQETCKEIGSDVLLSSHFKYHTDILYCIIYPGKIVLKWTGRRMLRHQGNFSNCKGLSCSLRLGTTSMQQVCFSENDE